MNILPARIIFLFARLEKMNRDIEARRLAAKAAKLAEELKP